MNPQSDAHSQDRLSRAGDLSQSSAGGHRQRRPAPVGDLQVLGGAEAGVTEQPVGAGDGAGGPPLALRLHDLEGVRGEAVVVLDGNQVHVLLKVFYGELFRAYLRGGSWEDRSWERSCRSWPPGSPESGRGGIED